MAELCRWNHSESKKGSSSSTLPPTELHVADNFVLLNPWRWRRYVGKSGYDIASHLLSGAN